MAPTMLHVGAIQDHQARVHPPNRPILDIAITPSAIRGSRHTDGRPQAELVRGQLAVPNELAAVQVDCTPSVCDDVAPPLGPPRTLIASAARTPPTCIANFLFTFVSQLTRGHPSANAVDFGAAPR